MGKRSKLLVPLSLVLFLFVGSWEVAQGQEITGTITGFVRDSAGAVIPNAQVTILLTETGLERRLKTGADGEYTVTLLPIGTYSVTVEASGFKKFQTQNIKLSVNDRLRVDATLEIGSISETVTVVGEAPVVQTESSEVGSVITGNVVREVPLNGRNLYQLIALQPGVSAGSSIVSGRVGVGLDTTSSINVNGARASQNNWLIDGADNVDTGSNLAVINYVSVDSVSEFKILRGNYNAEFGRSGGGQINVVTKSGTNRFHGGAFEFWRNDIMDARNFFSTLDRTGDGKADPALLRYHNFGYNVGGPVLKDKLLFFFNQEYRRVKTVRGGGLVTTRVPTQRQRSGDFSEFASVIIKDPLTGQPFAGNVIPRDRLDLNALALVALFPLPNSSPAVLGGLRNYSTAAPSGRNYREELIRVDYNYSEAHKFFARYIHDTIPSTEPFGEVFGTIRSAFPGISDTQTNIPGRNAVGEWDWILSPTILNNLAFNYSRGAITSAITGQALRNRPGFNTPEIFPENPGHVIPGIIFGTPGGYLCPSLASAVGCGFDFFGPYNNNYGSYRFKDTFSMIKGSHSLKLGYLYSFEFKNENNASGTNGQFTFPGSSTSNYTTSGDAFADFLLGRASQYVENDVDITSHLRYDMHEAFIQDDWKAKSNLTFNIGVRWSFIRPPYDALNVLTNFDPARFNPARAYQIDASGNRVPGTGDPLNGLIVAGRTSPFGRRIVDSHADTFGPRFGFSWDPFHDGKTAVRGGYGIYFDRVLSGIALQNAFVNPPFVTTAAFLAAGAAGTPTLANPSAGARRNQDALVPSLISMSPNFLVPTTQHWSLGIQRELWWNFAIDASYVGNHGTHLLRAVRLNQTPVGTRAPAAASAPFRGFGTITERQTSASSSYDSLQVGVTKRMSKGLQLGIAYTWSKVITDSPDDRSTIPQNSGNLRAERALASYDKTHIFVANFLWEIPFFQGDRGVVYNLAGGWQVGGIVRGESGTPFTIFVSGNPANSFFGGSIRPNLIGDPNGPQTIDQWFNTAAFAAPAANTFGNAGRSLVRGPGIYLWDLAVYKNFRVTEAVRMQFRAEFFNAFNHTNFFNIGTTVGTPTFGRITSALEPRQVQLGLRLEF
jgi:hypothetical protein